MNAFEFTLRNRAGNRPPFALALACLLTLTSPVKCQLLGFKWCDNDLVSFDPFAGQVTQVHRPFSADECFVGLTYDERSDQLFTLSQVDWNLYAIDLQSLNIDLVATLEKPSGRMDVGGLTYDPIHDRLLTTISHFGPPGRDEPIWTELAEVNKSSGDWSSLGKIADGFVTSAVWDESSSQLVAFAKAGIGMEFPVSVVMVDPDSAMTSLVFETTIDALLGMTKKPGEDLFFTFANTDRGHFYATIDLSEKKLELLANSDGVRANGAIVYKNFEIADVPEPSMALPFVVAASIMMPRSRRKRI